jgi:carboxypeptidase T
LYGLRRGKILWGTNEQLSFGGKMLTRRRVGVAAALAASVAVVIPLSTAADAGFEPVAADAESVTYTVTGLNSIAERNAVARSGVDVLSADHGSMTVRASQAEAKKLRSAGHELLSVANVEKYLFERSMGANGKKKKPGDFPEEDSNFHNYDEMVAEVQQAASDHGDIVDVGSIGKSFEGRDIPLVKISDAAATDEDEPEVLFTCNMHAREHLTTEMCLRIVNRFTDGYESDPAIKSFVDSAEIWVVPQQNPDGIEFDIASGKYEGWRKTRKPNEGSNAIGTDPNRNYDFKWGCCGGSSEDPGADDYRGANPLDQPETKQIAEFVDSRVVGGTQQIKGHIDFHTFSELVLWPFGYTTDDTGEGMTEEEAARFKDIGTRMADTNGYTPEQASDLYVTDGSIDDWMWGKHKILSFTFEMYPSSGGMDGFYPPDEVIEKETSRNDAAVDILLKEVGAGGGSD